MAATKFQVKEMRNPHPRCALDIHTIRGMIQEADNMDKGLQTILGSRVQPFMMPPAACQHSYQTPLLWGINNFQNSLILDAVPCVFSFPSSSCIAALRFPFTAAPKIYYKLTGLRFSRWNKVNAMPRHTFEAVMIYHNAKWDYFDNVSWLISQQHSQHTGVLQRRTLRLSLTRSFLSRKPYRHEIYY
jgi:hypothetical protein